MYHGAALEGSPHLGQYVEAAMAAVSIASQLMGGGKKKKKKAPPPPPPPPPPRTNWLVPVALTLGAVGALGGGYVLLTGRRR